jgi:hypothetical protein
MSHPQRFRSTVPSSSRFRIGSRAPPFTQADSSPALAGAKRR